MMPAEGEMPIGCGCIVGMEKMKGKRTIKKLGEKTEN